MRLCIRIGHYGAIQILYYYYYVSGCQLCITYGWLCLLVARRSGGTGLLQSRASTGNASRLRSASGVSSEAAVLGGGLSVTGSLSNFSLYVFHPYGGGGQKKTSLAALENTFRRSALRAGSFLTFAARLCCCRFVSVVDILTPSWRTVLTVIFPWEPASFILSPFIYELLIVSDGTI